MEAVIRVQRAALHFTDESMIINTLGAFVLDFSMKKSIVFFKKIHYFISLIVFVIDFCKNHFLEKSFLASK
jgi:hypothetical protein